MKQPARYEQNTRYIWIKQAQSLNKRITCKILTDSVLQISHQARSYLMGRVDILKKISSLNRKSWVYVSPRKVMIYQQQNASDLHSLFLHFVVFMQTQMTIRSMLAVLNWDGIKKKNHSSTFFFGGGRWGQGGKDYPNSIPAGYICLL